MRFVARVIAVAVTAAVMSSVSLASAASVRPGTYKGTTRGGIQLHLTVAPSGRSGKFSYCGRNISFRLSGHRFSLHSGYISATGTFRGSRVTGRIKPSSCSGVSETYSAKLQR